MTRFGDAATEWAFQTGWRVVRRLPEGAAAAAFDAAADQMWRRRGPSVQQYERNLRRIDPTWTQGRIRELSRAGLRSYLRYWQEAFRLPAWSPERIRDGFDLVNRELLDEAVVSGTGAIMVPGHMANWDHAGAWACVRYGSVTSVAERLRPEGLFEQFLAYRRSLGMDILGLGDPDLVRSLVRRLKEGRIVALLGDRDISRNGVEVSLFGRPASFPAGPALLSILSGAPLYPVTMWFEEGGSRGFIHDRVEAPTGVARPEQVQRMMQQVADAFELGIRRDPTDWHMLQKVWLEDLDERKPS